MRPTAPVLAVLVLLVLASTPARAVPVAEESGRYLASSGASYFTDACARAHIVDLNNYDSSCRWLRGKDVDGLLLSARDEGSLAPATVKLRVCFYAEMDFILDCPPSNPECPVGWTFCATVPAGTKYVGVASATGVAVSWHVVIA